jgi:hypothetical protein
VPASWSRQLAELTHGERSSTICHARMMKSIASEGVVHVRRAKKEGALREREKLRGISVREGDRVGNPVLR